MSRLSQGISWVLVHIDWILAIVLAIVTSVLGIFQVMSLAQIVSVTLLVLATLSFGAIRDRDNALDLKRIANSIDNKNTAIISGEPILTDKAITGISRVYPQVVGFHWLPLIQQARQVTIVRTRMDFGDNPDYYSALAHILDRGGSVTLILADPRSPAMWMRYSEEPKPWQNPAAWTSGLQNIAYNVISLNAWMERLANNEHDIRKLKVGLFPHYPAQAFYQFDDTIHIYHYSYLQRGIHAPMFVFNNPNTSVYSYLLDSIDKIVSASTPIKDAVEEIEQLLNYGRLSDQIAHASHVEIVTSKA